MAVVSGYANVRGYGCENVRERKVIKIVPLPLDAKIACGASVALRF